jgi:hypothetical protein
MFNPDASNGDVNHRSLEGHAALGNHGHRKIYVNTGIRALIVTGQYGDLLYGMGEIQHFRGNNGEKKSERHGVGGIIPQFGRFCFRRCEHPLATTQSITTKALEQPPTTTKCFTTKSTKREEGRKAFCNDDALCIPASRFELAAESSLRLRTLRAVHQENDKPRDLSSASVDSVVN